MLKALRAANEKRQELWPTRRKPDLAFRGLEFGGEAGELQNKLKKLIRLRNAIARNRVEDCEMQEDELLAEIADEIGDNLITLDLIAMDLGIDMSAVTAEKFNRKSEEVGVPVYINLSQPMPDAFIFRSTRGDE